MRHTSTVATVACGVPLVNVLALDASGPGRRSTPDRRRPAGGARRLLRDEQLRGVQDVGAHRLARRPSASPASTRPGRPGARRRCRRALRDGPRGRDAAAQHHVPQPVDERREPPLPDAASSTRWKRRSCSHIRNSSSAAAARLHRLVDAGAARGGPRRRAACTARRVAGTSSSSRSAKTSSRSCSEVCSTRTPAVALEPHHALLGQLDQRLPDRRARDPELVGQRLHRVQRAGRQLAGDDGGAQRRRGRCALTLWSAQVAHRGPPCGGRVACHSHRSTVSRARRGAG